VVVKNLEDPKRVLAFCQLLPPCLPCCLIEQAAQLAAERCFIAVKAHDHGSAKSARSQARQGERVSGLGGQQGKKSELRSTVAIAVSKRVSAGCVRSPARFFRTVVRG
jgi:hypothetical protein